MFKMRSAVNDLEFISNLDFFKQMQSQMIESIYQTLTPRLVEAGKKIYDVGDVSMELFIIRSGTVSCQVET
jgi:hypothetical protein